jgi:hypothetical protein
MSDPTGFTQAFVRGINDYINALENLNTLQDRLASDSGLAAAAATAAAAQLNRKDLVAADFTNAAAAIVQLNFTFNSGAPTQKSYLYKLL